MPDALQEHIVTTSHENNPDARIDQAPTPACSHAESLEKILHQLAHDLRSPLSIISMGIEAIRALKHDPSQLDAICDMMAQQGVDNIKTQITQLCDKAK